MTYRLQQETQSSDDITEHNNNLALSDSESTTSSTSTATSSTHHSNKSSSGSENSRRSNSSDVTQELRSQTPKRPLITQLNCNGSDVTPKDTPVTSPKTVREEKQPTEVESKVEEEKTDEMEYFRKQQQLLKQSSFSDVTPPPLPSPRHLPPVPPRSRSAQQRQPRVQPVPPQVSPAHPSHDVTHAHRTTSSDTSGSRRELPTWAARPQHSQHVCLAECSVSKPIFSCFIHFQILSYLKLALL